MISPTPTTDQLELAAKLRHLARAARAQADAIALNPDARAAGHIEVVRSVDKTLLLLGPGSS